MRPTRKPRQRIDLLYIRYIKAMYELYQWNYFLGSA